MGENHHQALNSSLAHSICSTYFKLKEFVDQLSGFTLPSFCVDWSKFAAGIQVLMMLIFWGSPCRTTLLKSWCQLIKSILFLIFILCMKIEWSTIFCSFLDSKILGLILSLRNNVVKRKRYLLIYVDFFYPIQKKKKLATKRPKAKQDKNVTKNVSSKNWTHILRKKQEKVSE